MLPRLKPSLVILAISLMFYLSGSVLAQTRNEWSAVSNKENPYDEVGVTHNQIVSAFLKSDDYRSLRESKNKNPKEVLTAYFAKCCATHIECCTGNTPSGGLTPSALIREPRIGRGPDAILIKLGVSRAVMEYARQVDAALRKLSKARAFMRSDFQPFFDLERAILKNGKLGNDDRKQALMMVAGARYSAYLWNGVRTSGVPSPPIDNGGAGFAKIDWDRVGAVDAMGCIGGPEAGAAASIIDYIFQVSGN